MFNPTESNTKITIINILDRYGSLNAKKIHSKLKKEFGVSITYQATHKSLKRMAEQAILIENDDGYNINPKWVTNMKVFINQLEKDPVTIKQIFSRLDEGKTVSFTVNSDMEMGYFALDFGYYFNKRFEESHIPLIFNFHFMWTVLPLSHDQFNMFKEIIDKRGVYATSKQGEIYDTIMKRHWEKAGAKVVIGVTDCISNCEVIVIGDYVIHNYWNPKHLEWNIDFTKKVQNERSFDYAEFYKVLSAPTKTEIVIIKNKKVAEMHREKTLSYF